MLNRAYGLTVSGYGKLAVHQSVSFGYIDIDIQLFAFAAVSYLSAAVGCIYFHIGRALYAAQSSDLRKHIYATFRHCQAYDKGTRFVLFAQVLGAPGLYGHNALRTFANAHIRTGWAYLKFHAAARQCTRRILICIVAGDYAVHTIGYVYRGSCHKLGGYRNRLIGHNECIRAARIFRERDLLT